MFPSKLARVSSNRIRVCFPSSPCSSAVEVGDDACSTVLSPAALSPFSPSTFCQHEGGTAVFHPVPSVAPSPMTTLPPCSMCWCPQRRGRHTQFLSHSSRAGPNQENSSRFPLQVPLSDDLPLSRGWWETCPQLDIQSWCPKLQIQGHPSV